MGTEVRTMDSAERVMWRTVLLCLLAAAAGATALPRARAAEDGAAAGRIEQMQEGESFTLGDRKVVVGKLDIVPYVENDFTKRCVFDAATNPKLVKLRMEYKLDDVIAPGKDEFEKQLLLMDWCAQRFEFGDPKNQGGLRNALEILRLSKREAQFFCVQRAALLVSTSAAVGFVCRPMGHSTHSWTEMWSNQYRKWVMMDPTTNYWVEKDGVPLSAY